MLPIADAFFSLPPASMTALGTGLGFALVRAIRGPRMADRIVGINMTGSLTTAIIAVLAVYLKESWLLDVCIIYCLISFLAVVVLAKINIVSHEKGEEFDDV